MTTSPAWETEAYGRAREDAGRGPHLEESRMSDPVTMLTEERPAALA